MYGERRRGGQGGEIVSWRCLVAGMLCHGEENLGGSEIIEEALFAEAVSSAPCCARAAAKRARHVAFGNERRAGGWRGRRLTKHETLMHSSHLLHIISRSTMLISAASSKIALPYLRLMKSRTRIIGGMYQAYIGELLQLVALATLGQQATQHHHVARYGLTAERADHFSPAHQ